MKRTVFRWLFVLPIAFIGAAFQVVLFCFVFLLFFVFASFPGNATFPADCGIVFGAAVHKGDVPGPGIRRRVLTATELYHAGNLQRLFFTGGVGDSIYQRKAEAVVMRDLAMDAGVPAAHIFLEEQATSTWENLLYTAPLLQDCHSIVAISDRYHLARIRYLVFLQGGLSEFMVHPADWHADLSFELLSVMREVLGIAYYTLLSL